MNQHVLKIQIILPRLTLYSKIKGHSFCYSMAIETGLSDFHKMTVTVLKNYIKKRQPRVINYRCNKNFNERIFRDELSQLIELINVDDINYKTFHDIFLKVLNSHAPMKQKTVRGNNSPNMTKKVNKGYYAKV